MYCKLCDSDTFICQFCATEQCSGGMKPDCPASGAPQWVAGRGNMCKRCGEKA